MKIFIFFIILLFIVISFVLLVNQPNDEQSAQNDKLIEKKYIHFVYNLWDIGELPDSAQKIIKEWQKAIDETDGNWEIKIWNKEQVYELFGKDPNILQLANSFPRKVMVADLARLWILYHYGGIYADIDLSIHKNILTFVDNSSIQTDLILFQETQIDEKYALRMAKIHKIRNGKPEDLVRIANYCIISLKKYNSFLLKCLILIRDRWQTHQTINNDYEILYITGPDVITTAFHHSVGLPVNKNKITLQQSQDWFTHHATGKWRLRNDV